MHETKLKFSIVIPTYNRPSQLFSCLASFIQLHYPRDRFEVIVVDDGGVYPLEQVIKQFYQQINLSLVTQPHCGPARARNTGVGFARGQYVAFTDDDCRAAPDWLAAMSARLAKDPERIIGGRTVNALPANRFSCASQLIVDAVYAHYNSNPECARFFATNNMAVSAQLFRELGGFDERFVLLACEDREFCDRWLHNGCQMTYAPEAIIYHAHQLTLLKYCRQHFTYGRGALHYHKVRTRRKSGRFSQDMRFHLNLDNWLLQPLRLTHGWKLLILASLLMLWQVTNASGFIYEIFVRSGYRNDSDYVGHHHAGKWTTTNGFSFTRKRR